MNIKNTIFYASIYFLLLFDISFSSTPKEASITLKIESGLKEIEGLLIKSRDNIVDVLMKEKLLKPIYNYSIYSSKTNETFSDHYHRSKSNIYLSYKIPVNNYLKKFIQTSEHFEPIFESNKKRLPTIGWQYVVEYRYSTMRFFPWFDGDNIMGNGLDWSKMQFYNMTKENRNNNKMLCTDASLDIAGLGFIVTCTLPIVFNKLDFGLIGVDIIIRDHFKEIQDMLGDELSEFAFIVSKKKKSILLKPTFYNYLFKNVINLNDLNFDQMKNFINKKTHNERYVDLKTNFVNWHLLIFEKIK